MKFEDYLGEQILEPAKEIQTIDDKREARELVLSTRGIQPGRYLGSDNKLTTDINSDTTSLIIKNDAYELVLFGTGPDDSILIRVVNKKKFTIRQYEILSRFRPLLKRFI